MAATAYEQTTHECSLADITALEPENLDTSKAYLLDADSISDLKFVRHRARQRSEEILEENRQKILEGDFDSVPIPVDALGTARRVTVAETLYGIDSPEYKEQYASLVLDCQRLRAEVRRNKTWEYFPKIEQEFDPTTSQYFSHGQSILDTVARGLSPLAESEERPRRSNEYVEEATCGALGALAVRSMMPAEEVSVRTISECPDWAIEAYERNSKGSYGGYVPAIKKLMLRDIHITSSGNRYEEQLGMSGLYITHEVIMAVLADKKVVMRNEELSKTELQGKQYVDTKLEGVVAFAATLDCRASEISGKSIFMGEVVPDSYIKDYSAIPMQAAKRQEEDIPKSRELVDFILGLEKRDVDQWAAEGIIEAYLKEDFLKSLKKNPEQAAEVFDKATAVGLTEVARLESLGLYAQAQVLEAEVAKAAPAPSYCGAGSCGLKAVNALSEESEVGSKFGFSGELLKDTVRSCPGCGKKNIIYEVKTGHKGCTACGKSTKITAKDKTKK